MMKRRQKRQQKSGKCSRALCAATGSLAVVRSAALSAPPVCFCIVSVSVCQRVQHAS